MIKLLASLFMLIDHIGCIIFPNITVLRIIGRLSMPLFAYSVARGFFYAERNGTTARYIKNLVFFSVASQVPFAVFSLWIKNAFSFNIGLTWLLSVVLLKTAQSGRSPLRRSVICAFILMSSLLFPIDYSLYGVLMPGVFYLAFYRYQKPQYGFYGMAVLLLLHMFLNGNSVVLQIFSLAAFPILAIVRSFDGTVQLPKRFYYWFYPAHIAVLLAIKAFAALIKYLLT